MISFPIIAPVHSIMNNGNNLYTDFNSFALLLADRMKQGLPGEEAQFKLAPQYRNRIDLTKLTGHKTGSVLLLIFPVENVPHLLFIERAEDGKVHSGQVAFPGGKRDPGDTSDEQTALRETMEEVGIDVSDISVAGKLTPLYIPPSNFLVNPFIGLMKKYPEFILSANEVRRTIIVPINSFFKENLIRMQEKHQTFRGEVVAPAYVIDNVKIWGATSMILTEFLELINNNKNS